MKQEMKRLLMIILPLWQLAVSCAPEPCSKCAEEFGLNHVSLSLQGSCIETRALDVPSLSESNVMRCDLFVFDSGGALVERVLSTDGRFDFYLTDGVYDFVAVANKGDLPAKDVSRDDLMSTIVTLGENAPGSFVMAGSLDSHEILSDEKTTIEVERLVAKVSCTVRTAFKGYLADESLRIDAVYLTNVKALARIGEPHSDGVPDSLWYNRMAYEPSVADYPRGLLYENCGAAMPPRDSIVTGYSFYPFPNSAADDHDVSRWSPRCTRLVVEATLLGRKTYYPVTIGKVESNRHYMVDLTVSNFGTDHPEGFPDKYGDIAFSVKVEDWTDGGNLEGIY